MIEISERSPDGVQVVGDHDSDGAVQILGHVVRTDKRLWLAIPVHYRNLPWSVHKLKRDAVLAPGKR